MKDIEVGDEFLNAEGDTFVVIGFNYGEGYKVRYKSTGYENTYTKKEILNTTENVDHIKHRINKHKATFVKIDNPFPENDLPDLDYGGCRVLGYAGLCEKGKTSMYFFKCHCGNTFKQGATGIIKVYNPSCGCSLEKKVWRESASLFEKQMETWKPDTENPLEKKLPIFSGIVGREKVIGFSLVDKEVYDVWSKIMWVQDSAGYAIASYSKDNCRRLGITPPKDRRKLTLHLHRCVLGLGHDTDYKGDHINSDTADNRKLNLRIATLAQNNYNKGVIKNKRGILGVRFKSHRNEYDKNGTLNKRWYAEIMINNRYRSKAFHTKEEASWYRDLMAVDLFGEFASLNHPENLEEYKSKLHTLHYK